MSFSSPLDRHSLEHSPDVFDDPSHSSIIEASFSTVPGLVTLHPRLQVCHTLDHTAPSSLIAPFSVASDAVVEHLSHDPIIDASFPTVLEDTTFRQQSLVRHSSDVALTNSVGPVSITSDVLFTDEFQSRTPGLHAPFPTTFEETTLHCQSRSCHVLENATQSTLVVPLSITSDVEVAPLPASTLCQAGQRQSLHGHSSFNTSIREREITRSLEHVSEAAPLGVDSRSLRLFASVTRPQHRLSPAEQVSSSHRSRRSTRRTNVLHKHLRRNAPKPIDSFACTHCVHSFIDENMCKHRKKVSIVKQKVDPELNLRCAICHSGFSTHMFKFRTCQNANCVKKSHTMLQKSSFRDIRDYIRRVPFTPHTFVQDMRIAPQETHSLDPIVSDTGPAISHIDDVATIAYSPFIAPTEIDEESLEDMQPQIVPSIHCQSSCSFLIPLGPGGTFQCGKDCAKLSSHCGRCFCHVHSDSNTISSQERCSFIIGQIDEHVFTCRKLVEPNSPSPCFCSFHSFTSEVCYGPKDMDTETQAREEHVSPTIPFIPNGFVPRWPFTFTEHTSALDITRQFATLGKTHIRIGNSDSYVFCPVLDFPIHPDHQDEFSRAIELFVDTVPKVGLDSQIEHAARYVDGIINPLNEHTYTWTVLHPTNNVGMYKNNISHDTIFHIELFTWEIFSSLLTDTAFTVLGCRRVQTSDECIFQLDFHPNAVVLLHKDASTTLRMADICSGMGGFGLAGRHCQARTLVSLDINDIWREHATSNTCGHFHCMDAFKPDMLSVLARYPINCICAGICCQSFSTQGQQLGTRDHRGVIIIPVLRAALILGIPYLILECTPKILDDKHIQNILNSALFYLDAKLAQGIFKSSHRLPSLRDRWLCCVYPSRAPTTAPIKWQLQSGGLVRRNLDVAHVIVDWEPHHDNIHLQLTNLELDKYRQDFQQEINSRNIHKLQKLPTILHSYGNLWRACACTCRSTPFSEQTMASGIRGVLVPTPNDSWRFLHMEEIALLTGFASDIYHSNDPRLDLSGIGQAIPSVMAASAFGFVQDLMLDNHHVQGSFLFSHQLTNVLRTECQSLPRHSQSSSFCARLVFWHSTWEVPLAFWVDRYSTIDEVLRQHQELETFDGDQLFVYDKKLQAHVTVLLIDHQVVSNVPLAEVPMRIFYHTLATRFVTDHRVSLPELLITLEDAFTRMLQPDGSEEIHVKQHIQVPWNRKVKSYLVSKRRTFLDVQAFLKNRITHRAFSFHADHRQRTLDDFVVPHQGTVYIHLEYLPGGMQKTTTDNRHSDIPYEVKGLTMFLRGVTHSPCRKFTFRIPWTKQEYDLLVAEHITSTHLAHYLQAQYPTLDFLPMIWHRERAFSLNPNIRLNTLPTTCTITWKYKPIGSDPTMHPTDTPYASPPGTLEKDVQTDISFHPLDYITLDTSKPDRWNTNPQYDQTAQADSYSSDRWNADQSYAASTSHNTWIGQETTTQSEHSDRQWISQPGTRNHLLTRKLNTYLSAMNEGLDTVEVWTYLPWEQSFRTLQFSVEANFDQIQKILQIVWPGNAFAFFENGSELKPHHKLSYCQVLHIHVKSCVVGGGPSTQNTDMEMNNMQVDSIDAWSKWSNVQKQGQGGSTSSHSHVNNPRTRNESSSRIPPWKKGDDLCNTLAGLFHAKGMQEKHTINQAKIMIQKIGNKLIKQAFETEDSWTTIKTLAEQHHFELLPRALCTPAQINIPPPNLRTIPYQDLIVQPGDFLNQATKETLKMLPFSDLSSVVEGVIICPPKDTLPYLKLDKKISSGALALIAPFSQDDTPLGEGQLEHFNFALTNRVNGLTHTFACYLVQLGQIPVTRNCTNGKIKEPTATCTVFANIHKKDADTLWLEIVKQPIKYLVTNIPKLQELVISCVRTSNQKKQNFVSVQILLKETNLHEILKYSGLHHIFIMIDPTDEKHYSAYRPIWLQGATLAEALVKTKLDERCLGVIKKLRKSFDTFQVLYAILVLEKDFIEVRTKITGTSPDSSFVSSRYRFMVSPLPVGTDREEIIHMLDALKWQFRPLFAKDPTSWIVGSETFPSKYYVSYDTGDISIVHIKPQNRNSTPRSQSSTGTFSKSFAFSSPSLAKDEMVDARFKELKNEMDALKNMCSDQQKKNQESFEQMRDNIQQGTKGLATMVENRCASMEQNMQELRNQFVAQQQLAHQQQQAFLESHATESATFKQDILQEMKMARESLVELFQQHITGTQKGEFKRPRSHSREAL